MPSNLKIPSPWMQLALLSVLAGCALILGQVVSSFLPGVHLPAIPTDAGTLKLLQTVGSVIDFGIPALFYALLCFRQRPLEELGFRPAVKSSFYLIAVVALLCAFPLEGWLGMLNKHLPMSASMIKTDEENSRLVMKMLSGNRPVDLITNLVVVAVIPGIVEEACFRGALQRVLIQLFRSPWLGIIATGVWFSLSHLEFSGFLPRTFLGILLGALHWYGGSLWAVILAHIFFNGIQVVAASWYPNMVTENPSVPFYLALLSLILVVGLLLYMRKRSTISYAQVYQ